MAPDKKTCAYLGSILVATIYLVTQTWNVWVPGNILRRGDQSFLASGGNAVTTNFTNYTELFQTAYHRKLDERHLNPHDFRLLLDEPMACIEPGRGHPKSVLLLVLVTSKHANFDRRQAIRETWGSLKEIRNRAIVTLFLLGKGTTSHLLKKVSAESVEHHDLLMEDFVDSYKNLTLKTMMAMKWASTHCPQASFVMKTDDDMFVSYRNLLDYLAATAAPGTGFALGRVLKGESPYRDPKSKYYVSRELYPSDVYPPWLSGGGFVLSGDMPGRIYAVSLDTKYLPLEDVYLGLCLQKLNATLTTSDRFNNMHIGYSYCRFHYIITSHRFGPAELRTVWKDLKAQRDCWFWT
ncbi:beta-1,3-galactosyltransferase 1-like [Acanthaster planci]|uniref:Hexosyltransferase n=1 Tax=Acanthaster planci TaxID=133434 RepID=A0A8B8A0L1_ACAPL|nr:beta-1,3-galactosyltransferase 1-like [Acanthaster planci]XP_022110888.1 beta-1,3-galactosyltransferase 1-like [Acanthaster planci]XP_022110889.1 beta-1,3-galactosyltransferase 1-like [Acanthaster planci]XP_022110890.1 beta-1,3-galactosyltransferase 1-like [Acanthaster planci]XP_022110892.1 beta-1,3-galactosyltransferase 1-like [Acanthaster planci]